MMCRLKADMSYLSVMLHIYRHHIEFLLQSSVLLLPVLVIGREPYKTDFRRLMLRTRTIRHIKAYSRAIHTCASEPWCLRVPPAGVEGPGGTPLEFVRGVGVEGVGG